MDIWINVPSSEFWDNKIPFSSIISLVYWFKSTRISQMKDLPIRHSERWKLHSFEIINFSFSSFIWENLDFLMIIPEKLSKNSFCYLKISTTVPGDFWLSFCLWGRSKTTLTGKGGGGIRQMSTFVNEGGGGSKSYKRWQIWAIFRLIIQILKFRKFCSLFCLKNHFSPLI